MTETLNPGLPHSMPAAVIRGLRDIAVVELPLPTPGPGEVLVEVSHCGICGSDLHYILEWGPIRRDAVEGHEWSGTVAAVGPLVDTWRTGDRVVVGPMATCGTCEPCRGGRPSLCAERSKPGIDFYQGAFARYKVHPAGELLAVPAGLDLRHAALVEPLAVALHGISRAGGAGAGQRWLILGGGPIGYLAAAALVAEGVPEVVVSEPHATRRELCAQLGAKSLAPQALPPAPELPMDVIDSPFDIALDCSGNAGAMEHALGLLRRGGTLVIVGSGLERPRFDSNRILLNELVVTGSNTYDADGFPRALQLLCSGRLPLELLVEPAAVGLHGLLDAAVGLGAGRLARKVLVTPGA